MTSDGLGEMFEGDFADMCLQKNSLVLKVDKQTTDKGRQIFYATPFNNEHYICKGRKRKKMLNKISYRSKFIVILYIFDYYNKPYPQIQGNGKRLTSFTD